MSAELEENHMDYNTELGLLKHQLQTLNSNQKLFMRYVRESQDQDEILRQETKDLLSAIYDIKLDIRTIQERQLRSDIVLKTFLGAITSIAVAAIVMFIRANI